MNYARESFPYLIAWGPVLVFFVWRYFQRPSTSAGLVPSYLFNMWMYYWIAAFCHYFAPDELENNPMLLAGIKECTIALYMFASGVLLFSGPLARTAGWLKPSAPVKPDLNLPIQYVIAGFCFQGVLGTTIGQIPGLNALTATGGGLILVGLSLGAWKAWILSGRRGVLRWLGLCTLLPLVSVIGMGFLGAGAIALANVMLFVARFFRPRWILMVGLGVASYVGISVYIIYTRDKTEIRNVMWSDADLSARVDRILLTFETFEWFDPSNPQHLEHIDARLNQVGLVGAGVINLENTKTFLGGETIWDAVIGVIPRAIWRDKPIRAGSSNLAARLTGLEFDETTSVGIGPVLEFYGNFGRWGVVLGFLVIGISVGMVDRVAAQALDSGDWQRFGLWFLVGGTLIQVVGSLFEVTSSVIGAIVIGRITNHFLTKRRQRQVKLPVPVA